MPPFQDPEIYRDILDHLQIGVSVLDLERKIVFWSDGAEQITGYARLDVLGHSSIDNILLHCNQIRCEMCLQSCPVATALHDARPMETAGFIHHKTGHRAPVHIRAIPLRDRSGSIIGVIQTLALEFAAAGPDPNEESMRERGCIDEVTGFPNQQMMRSHLRESLGTFAELSIPLGVVCVVADGLTQFRARYGQEAGSSMLRVLARTLRSAVWPTDFVGRWSDTLFMAILSGCKQEALHGVAERVLAMMESATIQWWGEELSMPVSTGYAPAQVGDSVETILERVQQALAGTQAALAGHAATAAGTNPSPPH